ncbi:hypothetical protein [Streptomyces sp. NPDC059080]|uniref:hypothetical protein n=1 Tax=Streptomyces sp. NPDC059080 TaxID=3346718 RepID=UPI0036CF4D6D
MDLVKGDYGCQRAAVAVHGVCSSGRYGIGLLRGATGSPLVVGASLLRQVAALVYLSGLAVFVALTLRLYGIRERGGRIRSSWAIAK